MQYVKLGNTGLDVSRLCLGCMSFGVAERWIHPWVLDEERSRPLIKKALEIGINFFDTANVYADRTSEEIVGRALRILLTGMRLLSRPRFIFVCIKDLTA